MLRNKWAVTVIALSALAMFAVGAVLVKAPFWAPGDIFSYLGWSQSIVDTGHIDFVSLSWVRILYDSFPLLFMMPAVLSIITTIDIPYLIVALNILMIGLLTFGYYVAANAIFNDKRIATISAMFGLTSGNVLAFAPHPNENFPIFSTLQFSLIFFLGALAIYARIIKKTGALQWPLVGAFILILTSTILLHPQSSIFRGSVFVFVSAALWVIQQNKRPFFARLALLSALPWALVVCLNVGDIGYFLGVGENVAVNDTLNLAKDIEAPRVLASLGELRLFPALFALILILRGRMRQKNKLATIAVLLITLLILLCIYQSLFGLSFFPGRFISELTIPINLLAGMGLVFCIDYLKTRHLKPLGLTLAGIAVISSVFLYFTTITRAGFDRDWHYVQAMQWAHDNIRGSKVIADPFTLYMFQGYADLTPAYYYIRTLKFNQSNEFLTTVFTYGSEEEAYAFLKKQRIQYVIIDTYSSPRWMGGTYERFDDTSKYKLVYSIKLKTNDGIVKIFEVL